MFSKGIWKSAGIALCALAPMTMQAAADKDGKNPPTVEDRIRALEKRVRDLEASLEDRAGNPNRQQQRFNNQIQGNFPEEMQEMLEQFQNQFGRNGLNVPNGFTIPFQRGGNFGGAIAGMNKPRLGVELAPASEELRERFKNNAQDGAFVTSVVPNSPAEKAGINVGDAVVSFGAKAITQPADLIEAVRAAPQGKNEIQVKRRGEDLILKVDLGAVQAEDVAVENDGWLRRDGGAPRPGTTTQTRSEVKASALELPETLAKDLKLTDDQRKKMNDILAKHAKALSDEVSNSTSQNAKRRGGFAFSYRGNVGESAEKHADDAAKELADVLSADQLKKWNEHRRTHNSISVQHSTVIESHGGGNEVPPHDNF